MQTKLIIYFFVCLFWKGCRQMSKSWLTWDPVVLPKLIALLSPHLPTHWSLSWHFETSARFLQSLTAVLVCIRCDKLDTWSAFCYVLKCLWTGLDSLVISGMWEDNLLSTPSFQIALTDWPTSNYFTRGLFWSCSSLQEICVWDPSSCLLQDFQHPLFTWCSETSDCIS